MRLFYLSLLALVAWSCGPELKREDLLPDATGAQGQVILLMEDDLWNGSIGEAVMYHLDQDARGPYLRSEPMFTVTRIRPDELSHLTQLNQLLLKVMVDTDSSYKQTAVIEKENYFAKGQLFLIVKDSDPDRLFSFVVNEFAYVVNRMNDFQEAATIKRLKKNANDAIRATAERNHGISISVPKLAEIRVDSTDFTWIKHDRSRVVQGNATSHHSSETYWVQQGIVIWSKPYSDTSQLTIAGALRDRDTVLKYNIPGKVEGSYMATEYDPYYAPEGRVFKYKDAYAIELSGLWKHAGNPNAFGGGPFVQYVLHHPSRETVVTVCIYIYGPNFDKREYIRESFAILKTIEFVN